MKTDPKLGQQVHQHLIDLGIETPMSSKEKSNPQFEEAGLEANFRDIMRILHLDLEDDSLKDTPKRVAKMYANELFYGMNYENFPKCTTIENKMKYDEMVTVKDITSLSVCEHHFVTIDGKVKVSYIPKNLVIGLSKLNRIVDFFSRRPQVQERLTEQIYAALSFILQTPNVAVRIEAVHYCVKCRGVKDTHSATITTKVGGNYKKPEVRSEFLKG